MSLRSINSETYLTPNEVSDYFDRKIGIQTLANWRSTGEGPAFLKLGGRVVYPLSFLQSWEKSRLHSAGGPIADAA